MLLRAQTFGCLLGLVLLSGCNQPTIAPVTGRVTCNGKAVDGAAIVFSPIPKSDDDLTPGKPATGFSDAEGKFVLSTFRPYDGALVAKHRVKVSLEDNNPARCKRVTQVNLEVVSGSNDLKIDLTP